MDLERRRCRVTILDWAAEGLERNERYVFHGAHKVGKPLESIAESDCEQNRADGTSYETLKSFLRAQFYQGGPSQGYPDQVGGNIVNDHERSGEQEPHEAVVYVGNVGGALNNADQNSHERPGKLLELISQTETPEGQHKEDYSHKHESVGNYLVISENKLHGGVVATKSLELRSEENSEKEKICYQKPVPPEREKEGQFVLLLPVPLQLGDLVEDGPDQTHH